MLATSLLLIALAQVQAPPVRTTELEQSNLNQLLTVRRVYIEKLSGGEAAAQLRDMIISSLERSKTFAITENPDRADAILRGSADDSVYNESFSSSEGINARANSGIYSGARNNKSRGGGYIGSTVGENDSVHLTERKHEASASVRLVTKDGDVIWSTTQESLGAKFRGASADVADKVTRQLLLDLDRARKSTASKSTPE